MATPQSSRPQLTPEQKEARDKFITTTLIRWAGFVAGVIAGVVLCVHVGILLGGAAIVSSLISSPAGDQGRAAAGKYLRKLYNDFRTPGREKAAWKQEDAARKKRMKNALKSDPLPPNFKKAMEDENGRAWKQLIDNGKGNRFKTDDAARDYIHDQLTQLESDAEKRYLDEMQEWRAQFPGAKETKGRLPKTPRKARRQAFRKAFWQTWDDVHLNEKNRGFIHFIPNVWRQFSKAWREGHKAFIAPSEPNAEHEAIEQRYRDEMARIDRRRVDRMELQKARGVEEHHPEGLSLSPQAQLDALRDKRAKLLVDFTINSNDIGQWATDEGGKERAERLLEETLRYLGNHIKPLQKEHEKKKHKEKDAEKSEELKLLEAQQKNAQERLDRLRDITDPRSAVARTNEDVLSVKKRAIDELTKLKADHDRNMAAIDAQIAKQIESMRPSKAPATTAPAAAAPATA
jgi:hypothetical protein